MSKEWYDSNEFQDSVTESVTPIDNTMLPGNEISAPGLEYVQPVEDYDWEKQKEDSTQEKEQLHKKRLRKTLYGLASMVMVVSLGQTLSSKVALPDLSKQPVLFSVYNKSIDYAKGGMIIVGGPDIIWGVGHVPLDLRLVDYNGDSIEIETTKRYGYHGKWLNSKGYFLADTYGNNEYTLFNKQGKVLYEWRDDDYPKSNMISAAISNNNIVFIQRTIRTDAGDVIKNSYFTIRGKELCSIDCNGINLSTEINAYGTPFRDGIALCNDNNGIIQIRENGKTTRLVTWEDTSDGYDMKSRFQVERNGTLQGSNGDYILDNVPCIVAGNVSSGYFMVKDLRDKLALVNVETGKMYKLEEWSYTEDPESSASRRYIKYSDNEGMMLHIGSLMCVRKTDKENTSKSYLFDVLKHCDEEGKRVGYFACHDVIYFENYKYLLARDGDEYFYIDYEGNKVSESYKKATTFNDFGYALVQMESGVVYVIDSEFHKIKYLNEIQDFEEKDHGEVFWVTSDGESHSYYYGPDVID